MDNWEKAGDVIKGGGVAILPTDTIYGLHCLAFNKKAVERVYRIKGRDFTKPFIILIPCKEALESFGVTINTNLSAILDKYWLGPNSIILPVVSDRLEYLHRGTKSLAFRLPNYQPLLDLLKQTGPLVSTSANPSGKDPASDITTAKEYFGSLVDYYLDAEKLDNPPSRVFKLTGGKVMQMR